MQDVEVCDFQLLIIASKISFSKIGKFWVVNFEVMHHDTEESAWRIPFHLEVFSVFLDILCILLSTGLMLMAAVMIDLVIRAMAM